MQFEAVSARYWNSSTASMQLIDCTEVGYKDIINFSRPAIFALCQANCHAIVTVDYFYQQEGIAGSRMSKAIC